MTNEKISGNHTIAAFMGFKTWVTADNQLMAEDENGFAGHFSEITCHKYSDSWDLLMAVIVRIESLGSPVEICGGSCAIFENKYKNADEVISVVSGNKLYSTFSNVVQFIRIYNQVKSSPER